jgi:hypothetical protein
MVGTFADVVVADAVVKGVPGFDLTLAKDALIKDVRTDRYVTVCPFCPVDFPMLCVVMMVRVSAGEW